ncbi:hypothetical protein DOS70_00575, partial [Staphylococcus felis]|uniref:hypothetical protein n=1 Tax=Staphylococcus felis TaxID=46127 RepID=UPI000E3A0436
SNVAIKSHNISIKTLTTTHIMPIIFLFLKKRIKKPNVRKNKLAFPINKNKIMEGITIPNRT